eukprot:c16796_g1_i1.p1 GENE.c16796_g1_i1~~c16796_g1_i1.p1  ORF type:complete len:100 (+),score=14.93 c16796_g1_i1:291-590(+)
MNEDAEGAFKVVLQSVGLSLRDVQDYDLHHLRSKTFTARHTSFDTFVFVCNLKSGYNFPEYTWVEEREVIRRFDKRGLARQMRKVCFTTPKSDNESLMA